MTDPVLFPAPRHVDAFDGSLRTTATVTVAADPGLPAQGYDLRIEDGRAHLAHADPAGRRYGEQTLEQLRRADGSLPGIHVRDWPDLPVRGYMLDISRDRVPTRGTLARLVELLARCRYNHLQLYVEHTVAYTGHETVWRDASPLTLDDLSWLDEQCAAAGIDLAANQNCFGHMGRWLRHGTYRDRAECPDGVGVVPGLDLPPTVLAPTPDNAAFALDLVREQMSALRSPTVNVGCDETFDLGRGVSRARAEAMGVAGLYHEHLCRLVGPLVAEGRSVLFWGDVLRDHPDLLARLPEGDVTPIVWTYDAPGGPQPDVPPEIRRIMDELGFDNEARGFAAHVAPFSAAGAPFWVAPGTSTWGSFTGRLDNAYDNLLDAATTAVDAGAGGYLVTDWGDGGHLQPPSVSLPPLAYGGAVSWCAASNRDLDVAATVDRTLVGDPTGTVGGVLDAIGRVATRTGMVGGGCSPLAVAVLPHQFHLASGDPDPDAVLAVIDTLDAATTDLERARPGATDGDVVLDELAVAIGLARHGAVRLAARAGARPDDLAAHRADLADLVDRQRTAWLARSRPGGLDDSLGQLTRTLRRYDRELGTRSPESAPSPTSP